VKESNTKYMKKRKIGFVKKEGEKERKKRKIENI